MGGFLLKGQCHEMDIVFEGINILISTFCLCADGFQDLSKACHYPIFASSKLLTNFENACLNPPYNSLLCDWSMFSNADLSLAA